MKNWRTTIIGALLAAVAAIALYQQSGGDLANWQQWVVPALIACLGYLAKDAGVTGGIKILALLLPLGLVSCAGMPITFSAGLSGKTKDGTDYHVNASVPLGARTSAKEVYEVNP